MTERRFRPEQWILSNRDAGCDVQPITWLLWSYGDQPALRSSRAPFRPHRVILVWRVRIVSQTVDSEICANFILTLFVKIKF